MSGAEHPEIRLSDADREQAVTRLNDAVAEGRLTLSEFEERVTHVLQARTEPELTPLLADLPGQAVTSAHVSQPEPAAHTGTAVPTQPDQPTQPPVPQPHATAAEQAHVRTRFGTVKRDGHWTVPRRLRVHSRAGTAVLDLTKATITHPVVEVELDSYGGVVTLILPEGASVDLEPLETDSVASRTRVRDVPTSPEPTGQPHVVLSGKQRGGTLIVRHTHRLLRRRR